MAYLLLIHYFTRLSGPLIPWPWPLTIDLEHLHRITCDVMKLCTKFQRKRTIPGGVIAFSVFELMTLNIALRVVLGSGISFTKFDLRQLIRAWIIAFLCWYIMSRCDLDLWPLDLELFRWYAFVQNMIEIGLNYWFFFKFLHILSHAVTLIFDLLTLQ